MRHEPDCWQISAGFRRRVAPSSFKHEQMKSSWAAVIKPNSEHYESTPIEPHRDSTERERERILQQSQRFPSCQLNKAHFNWNGLKETSRGKERWRDKQKSTLPAVDWSQLQFRFKLRKKTRCCYLTTNLWLVSQQLCRSKAELWSFLIHFNPLSLV